MNQQITQFIPLARIRRNPMIDPRKGRKKSDYEKLVNLIKSNGILQPILVRPVNDDPCYDVEVVAGNSRWSGSDHPFLSNYQWLHEVRNNQTQRGYWQWVVAELSAPRHNSRP